MAHPNPSGGDHVSTPSKNVKRRVAGSEEPVGTIVVNLDPADESGQTAGDSLVGVTVEFYLREQGDTTALTGVTWLAASWVGTPTTTGYAETTANVTFAAGDWDLFVRFDATVIEECRHIYRVTA
jgi:hypothetical protein